MAVAAPRLPHLRAPARRLEHASDERLVAALRAGDERAFEVLYDRHHRPLLAFCRHLLGSREEGEDALQHVFISAHRHLTDGGSREIQLKPWLYAIARNRCLSVLRARRPADPLEDVREPATDGLAVADEVQRRQDLKDLLGDLARLPEPQREALLLAELSGLAHEEIGAVLGVRRDKVKALVFQAREGLAGFRQAREADCRDVQEQLATLHGSALRRGPLRRHVAVCAACSAFEAEIARQRAALALVLPVVPAVALKSSVLATVLGAEGAAGITASAGAGAGAAAGSAVPAGAGAASAAAAPAGFGAAGSGLAAKVLAVVALAGTAGGGAAAVEHRSAGPSRSAAPVPAAAGAPTPGAAPTHVAPVTPTPAAVMPGSSRRGPGATPARPGRPGRSGAAAQSPAAEGKAAEGKDRARGHTKPGHADRGGPDVRPDTDTDTGSGPGRGDAGQGPATGGGEGSGARGGAAAPDKPARGGARSPRSAPRGPAAREHSAGATEPGRGRSGGSAPRGPSAGTPTPEPAATAAPAPAAGRVRKVPVRPPQAALPEAVPPVSAVATPDLPTPGAPSRSKRS